MKAASCQRSIAQDSAIEHRHRTFDSVTWRKVRKPDAAKMSAVSSSLMPCTCMSAELSAVTIAESGTNVRPFLGGLSPPYRYSQIPAPQSLG